MTIGNDIRMGLCVCVKCSNINLILACHMIMWSSQMWPQKWVIQRIGHINWNDSIDRNRNLLFLVANWENNQNSFYLSVMIDSLLIMTDKCDCHHLQTDQWWWWLINWVIWFVSIVGMFVSVCVGPRRGNINWSNGESIGQKAWRTTKYGFGVPSSFMTRLASAHIDCPN